MNFHHRNKNKGIIEGIFHHRNKNEGILEQFLKPTKPRCFIEMHYLFCILEQKEQRIISMLETRIKLSYNGFSGTCEYLLK